MTMIGDIPKSVTLLNMTATPQMFESSLIVPAGRNGNFGVFVPGELTIDMTKLQAHRRERMWIAVQNANKGQTVKIKESEEAPAEPTPPTQHPEFSMDGPGPSTETSAIPAGAPAN